MKNTILLALGFYWMGFLAEAGITRISDGGQSIELSDIMIEDEPAVFVFYTSWNQDSLNMLNEIESWASDYPDLPVFFVDCMDQRTQVYRQFELNKIPSIVVYDEEENKVGSAVYEVDDLEDLLKANDLID